MRKRKIAFAKSVILAVILLAVFALPVFATEIPAQQNVPLNKEWRIQFNQPIDYNSLKDIVLHRTDITPVTVIDIDPELDPNDSSVVIVKQAIPFVPGASYELTVNTGVPCIAGGKLTDSASRAFSTEIGGSISGTLTDSNGKVLPGIVVTVYTSDGDIYGGQAITDAGGKYTIKGLAAEIYTVQFDRYLYNSQNDTNLLNNPLTGISVVQGHETPNINAQLAQGGGISGTVTDLNGQVLPGIAVSAYVKIGDIWDATTDANGKYSIHGLPVGTYTVEFDPELYDSKNAVNWVDTKQTGISVVQGKNIDNIDARLTLGGSISGTVTDSNGQVLQGIVVSTFTGNNDTISGATDAQGKYALYGLAAGTYEVQFDPEYNSQNRTDLIDTTQTGIAVVQGQGTPNINAQLVQGGSISGTVTDANGQALPGIVVTADSDNVYGGTAITDAHGKYTVKVLAAGIYEVHFAPDEYNAQNGTNLADNLQMRIAVVQGQNTDNINVRLKQGSDPIGVG